MTDPWEEGFPARPTATGPRIDVWTPTFARPIRATILSARLFTRKKHFDTTSRKPFVCTGREVCPYCVADCPSYLTGFMACCRTGTRVLGVLQLSESALEALRPYHNRHPVQRGLEVMTGRADARGNARMTLDVLGLLDPRDLPEPFDPRPVLERVWGMAVARLLSDATLTTADDQRTTPRTQEGR